jgi:hypothetical protein
MLGKVIGAVAGRKVSKHISGISGPGGAVLGVAAAALMRRMGPAGLVAAAVGGWVLKRHFEKQEAANLGAAPTR